ncbi:MAG: glycoside hydrolase family 18 [Anaerocolumna sp.]|nr:glycoside hydrolase family 18 [Anaerocolumna sp.]
MTKKLRHFYIVKEIPLKLYRKFIYTVTLGCLIFAVIWFIRIDEKALAATVKLNYKSITLDVGKSKTLSISGTKSKVTWSSSKNSVATVSTGGKVIAKAPGTATIYAKVDGKNLSSKLTVNAAIKLSNSTITLEKGLTKTLKVIGTTSKITWSSSKNSVATVSTGGKVTAKAPGITTIYAKVSGKTLTSKVTVKTSQSKPTAKPTPSATLPVDTETYISPIIVGYYAAWAKYSGFTPDKLVVSKLTHINYAFANISSDYKVVLGYPDIDSGNIKQLNQLKKANPKLKTIIAIGGWSWSGRFSDVALTDKARKAFADSALDFILKYGFDGIDIDWEYPVSGGLATNVKRPEDKYNFTLLMKTLREKLDAREAIDKKHYILSFAGATGKWYTENTQLRELSKYVDYANVMTYDIHGTWETNTGFNAPLYNDPKFSQYVSVDSSINSWINAGFANNKIVMGVPFYGYVYKGVANTNNGLNQTYSGGASISYANIVTNYLNAPGYEYFFHPVQRVPWLFNGFNFISYENEQSMAEKGKYIKEKKLMGAMIWELSQDPNRVLFNALHKELK